MEKRVMMMKEEMMQKERGSGLLWKGEEWGIGLGLERCGEVEVGGGRKERMRDNKRGGRWREVGGAAGWAGPRWVCPSVIGTSKAGAPSVHILLASSASI